MINNKFWRIVAFYLLVLFSFQLIAQNKKPNVLFIMVDDLRPELGCYNQDQILTPHMDKLANSGVLFKNAYCNIPVCGASRASLLTGILPTKERFVQYNTYASKDMPHAKTLPQVFKEAGYQTLSIGKVFHHNEDTETVSWSKPSWRFQGADYNSILSKDTSTLQYPSKKGRGRIYEMPEVEDAAYNDGQAAIQTIKELQNLKKMDKPFFIACGFVRPHLPFYAPRKYWDLYNRDSIDLAKNDFKPLNAPSSLHGSGEFRLYHLDGLHPKSVTFKRMMKHGYYASVSYVDKLIGDVLNELKQLNLNKNTIVVLWGDHGWHLGEHSFWGKHNTMKQALKVPLIIKAPGYLEAHQTDAIVESIDIFPTLCRLAEINLPKQLQGESFKKLLEKPNKEFRKYAYSRFLSADAVITKQYGYTHYTGKKDEIMLYDHKVDPEENKNVAGPKYTAVIKKMERYLKKSKRKASSYKSSL